MHIEGLFAQDMQDDPLQTSEWVSDQGFKSQLTILQSYRDWNKVYQAQWLGLWTRSCLYVVCMYWTRIVQDPRPVFVVLAHWNTTPWVSSDVPIQTIILILSRPIGVLTPLCWALSRAAEPQILTAFAWRGRGSNHQPPACQANAQPLHYPAADPLQTMHPYYVGKEPLTDIHPGWPKKVKFMVSHLSSYSRPECIWSTMCCHIERA